MSVRIPVMVVAFLLTAAAYAQTLLVYPFDSRGSFLGTIVADRVASAFSSEFETYGPAVSPSLVPPLPVGDGFLNPTEFLQGRGVANRFGSRILLGATGADAVLTGVVTAEDDRLLARLYLARGGGVESFLSSAPLDEPGSLAERIVAATARRLGAEVEPGDLTIDLSGDDGDLAQALALAAAGLTEDARRVLENISAPQGRAAELLEALQELESEGEDADPAMLAAFAVNRTPMDERLALRYFERFAGTAELPGASLWVAVLQTSLNDVAGAEAAYDSLPADFPYGQAARASFLSRGGGEGDGAALEQALEAGDLAALLGVAATATATSDLDLEKEALRRATRVAPSFPYPFERLSFIAFEQEDALAAAQALAVAVELEPESDLYWTNLGWAYYLLDSLEKSEEASRRAVEIAPDQYIAWYNLGLVLAVTDRLDESVEAYRQALGVDPEVDDAAIQDLEQALELYPGSPGVHYALGMLYEAEGRRAEAAAQFGAFADAAPESDYADIAVERAEVLNAPPPPIELSDGLVTVRLGAAAVDPAAPFHPGDPIAPRFEIYTPGDELPQQVDVFLVLRDAAGAEVTAGEWVVDIPRGAIGYVVDTLEMDLPRDLTAGAYRLDVTVRADAEREAAASVMFEVSGEPQLLRQLLGRNLVMQALETGMRLYGVGDLERPERLAETLVNELHSSADAAEEALPPVEGGRFDGMTGGELFRNSTASDVEDFLEYLLASGARDTTFVFAEAYAQWALEGAPEGEAP